MTTISNCDDTLDSREIIERIEELEEELEEEGALGEDDAQELRALRALAEDAEGYAANWRYGTTLIRDSYFKAYAQEFAEDTGVFDRNAGWPHNCIDWDEAAAELQLDYSAVDFDGVTYWVQC